jgi:hypothetical protein
MGAPTLTRLLKRNRALGVLKRVAAQAATGEGTAVTAGFKSPPSILEAVAGNYRSKHWACYAHFQAGLPLHTPLGFASLDHSPSGARFF